MVLYGSGMHSGVSAASVYCTQILNIMAEIEVAQASPKIRLVSYTLTTEPVKRMKVRTHGKRTSKVKTSQIVLRKAEQLYGGGGELTKISNKDKFNQHKKQPVDDWHDVLEYDYKKAMEYKEGLHIGEWIGTEKVKSVRGASTRYGISAEIPAESMDNVNTFLREILKFKRIDYERMLKDYKNFENKRAANVERIEALQKRLNLTPHRRQLLRDLRKKWVNCKAHCRYVISTEVFYDFTGTNDANHIKWRAMKVGSILVEKVFEDGGVFFNRKQCAAIKAWIDANLLTS